MGYCTVAFACKCPDTQPGDGVAVVGNHHALGAWDCHKAVRLQTSSQSFPIWNCDGLLSVSTIEFKFVITKSNGEFVWENGSNRTVDLCEGRCKVSGHFDKTGETAVSVQDHSATGVRESDLNLEIDNGMRPPVITANIFKQLTTASSASTTDTGNTLTTGTDKANTMRRLTSEELQLEYPAAAAITRHSVSNQSYLQCLQQVADVLRPIEDKIVRTVTDWRTLPGSRSEAIDGTQEEFRIAMNAVNDFLAAATTYLSFVSSGTIKCVEDRGHHRPCHHANIARHFVTIFEVLRWLTSGVESRCVVSGQSHSRAWEQTLTSFHILLSKFQSLLPSCSDQFTRPEPLTRIRDIAHRNDIPQDLKREIKTTLQNKLHRCAGPEDLVTALNFAERFNGNRHHYPDAFLHEFNIFVQDLKEFFNVSSLDTRLDSLKTSILSNCDKFKVPLEYTHSTNTGTGNTRRTGLTSDKFQAALISCVDVFRKEKSSNSNHHHHHNNEESIKHACYAKAIVLSEAARLRRILATVRIVIPVFGSNSIATIINDQDFEVKDVHDLLKAVAYPDVRQTLILCDADVERYYFTVLSELVGHLESWTVQTSNMGSSVQSRKEFWSLLVKVMTASIWQLNLSSISRVETSAIIKDLILAQEYVDALSDVLQLSHTGTKTSTTPLPFTDFILLFKSVCLRVTRLVQSVCDTVVGILPVYATQLGAAYSIPSHAVDMFAEAAVRSHLAFQVSRFVSLVSNEIRKLRCEPPVETIVSGTAVGVPLIVDSLLPAIVASKIDQQSNTGGIQQYILFVKGASGDEEVSGLRSLGVVGVVLAERLPLLSHFGVRARQDRLPLAACHEAAYFRQLFERAVHQSNLPAVMKCTPTDVTISRIMNAPTNESHSVVAVASDGLHQQETDATDSISKLKEDSTDWTLAGEAILRGGTHGVLFMDAQITAASCGPKAYSLYALDRLSKNTNNTKSQGSPLFSVPNKLAVLPFGSMHAFIILEKRTAEFEILMGRIEELDERILGGDSTLTTNQTEACNDIRTFVMDLKPTVEVELTKHLEYSLLPLVHIFGGVPKLILRSSSNVEDLPGMSGAGLYESVADVSHDSPDEIAGAICTVWASLYSDRAVSSRRTMGVPQRKASMAVLVTEFYFDLTHSFVVHTRHPLTGSERDMYIEVAPGFGEAIVGGGSGGAPHRITVNKRALNDAQAGAVPEVEVLSFSDLSSVQISAQRDATLRSSASQYGEIQELLLKRPATQRHDAGASLVYRASTAVDDSFVVDKGYRHHLVMRIARASLAVERHLGAAQDIEGSVRPKSGEAAIVLVQSRPQPKH
eukprot:Lankesteria_metandrocarpae@DN4891_c0_g1_i1.p1